MQKESPLLKKAREYHDRKRFTIPRKGRIRFILVIMLLGIGARVYFGDAQDNTSNPVLQTNSEGHGNKSNKSNKNSPSEKLSPQSLSREKISTILNSAKFDLNAPSDTIRYNGNTLIYHFSIDTTLQKDIRKLFRRYHPRHGSAVALDPRTGRVLAMVAYNNPDDRFLGTTTYRQSIFPAASIFKTITAAAAIERCHLTEGSLLKTVGRNHTLYNYQLEKSLNTFREVSLREAFAYSINPVFGRLGIHFITANGLLGTAQKFGFNEPIPFDISTDSPFIKVQDSSFHIAEIASGFNQQTQISPLFGALIASSISQEGTMPVPILVDSVTLASSGRLLYKADPRPWRRAMEKSTAERLSLLMQDVARYGTARKSFRYVKGSYHFNDIAYGGKTGNVDKDSLGRVDWFVGFAKHPSDSSQRIATGVVSVHGPYWTVHSSFLGAEIIRKHIRGVQIAQKEKEKAMQAAARKDSTNNTGDS